MRILSAISAYPPSTGGAQLHAHELNGALAALGTQVEVATLWRTTRRDWLRGSTFAAPTPEPPVDVDGISVRVVGLPPRKRRSAGLKGAMYYPAMTHMRAPLSDLYRDAWRRVVADVQPDVAHLSRIGREWWYQGLIDELREQGIPYVLTPNHHPHWGTRRRDGWWNDIYRGAGAVLALSDAELDAIAGLGVDPNRILRTVVACVGSPGASPPPRTGTRSVVFLGQVRRYKGLATVYRAMVEHVWPREADVHLTVIGPWVDSQKRLRARLEADDRVEVLGAVADDTKWNHLQAAAVLCVPSTQEALGGVYVEAWQAGCPAVGANIPAVRELFQRTGAGLAVEPNPEGVAEGILRVLKDDDLAHQLREAGLRAIRNEYNWPAAAARAIVAYELALTR